MRLLLLATAAVACALSMSALSAEKGTIEGPAKSETMDEQLSRMQANGERMQQQLEKIRSTTDPQERRRLMQEYMQTLHQNMMMMHRMSGSEGGPGMMGGPGRMARPRAASPAGMMGAPQGGYGAMGSPRSDESRSGVSGEPGTQSQ